MAKETLHSSLRNALDSLRAAKKQLAKLKVSPSNALTATHVAGAIDDACAAVEEAQELLGAIEGGREADKSPKRRTPSAMSETRIDMELKATMVKATKVK